MKTGLVPAIAVAALLLGSLIWWTARPSEAPTPGSHPRVEPAPSRASVHLSDDEAGPNETTRSEPTRSAIASRVLEGGVAAPGGATPGAVIASITQAGRETKSDDEVGSLVFERKYAWMTGEDRREALESLRVLLDGSAGNGLRKEPPLPEERSLEIKREIEWLTEHEAP